MIYVILGIIVLVVSFVVALISLVYEQKKVEEIESEGVAGTDAVLDAAQDTLAPVVHQEQPFAATPLHEHVKEQELPPVEDFTAREEGVWWNTLEPGTVVGEEPRALNEEEQSIQAIRDELSKIASEKSSHTTVLQEEPDTQDARNEAKKQRVLVGEFSLGDIKRQD